MRRPSAAVLARVQAATVAFLVAGTALAQGPVDSLRRAAEPVRQAMDTVRQAIDPMRSPDRPSTALIAAPGPRPVLVLNVHGVINAGSARYIARGVDEAAKRNASLLVVVLNTPGGLLNFTRDIVQKMNQSTVPVAVYVSPSGASATSAGTIITMGAHFAAMAPGTNIGAAHPVAGQGEEIKGAMNEKAVNDTVAFIKAQAQQHGRNADWAEQSIRKSVSATADEALKLKVVDFVVADLDALLMKVNPKVPVAGERIEELKPTAAEEVLSFLGDPNVSYLLMMLGGLGIYIEITSPGAVVPGIVGAISLILSFVSFATLPVNYAGVALLVLGIILFILEAFVTSYGALTLGGAVSLVLGALFLMDSSTGDLRLSLLLVVPTVLAIALITAFLAYSVFKSRKTVYVGLTDFSGFEGTVQSVSETGYSGKVLIRGEVWDFEAEGSLHAGDHVRVTGQEGFRLKVMRALPRDVQRKG